MSAREPWLEPGYGDVAAVAREGVLVGVTFDNGDIVQVNPSIFGASGDFEVSVGEGGASVALTSEDGSREIDWTVVRAATDPAFAQELRERDTEEARRIGRRLRALRENRGMSQKAVAGVVGMPPPQLAKLEQGETDMRISTLRSLLRALGATFADIAGPDAPELSTKELTKRAKSVGVPTDVIKRIASVVDPRQLPDVLGRAFGWDRHSIQAGRLTLPAPVVPVTLKRRPTTGDDGRALLALAESIARRSALAYQRDPGVVPSDPRALRDAVLPTGTELTLDALVHWCWDAGVIVVPMQARGGFSASAWQIDGQPIAVLKETPDYQAYWLFALAHELGHLGRGHVTRGGLIDVERAWEGQEDEQEKEANAYALDLLVPGHQEMLEEIRQRLRGLDEPANFKFKAIDAARARGYNVPLVLLVAAFGLPDLARDRDRWGSAMNEAKLEGSARALVAHKFERNVDLEQLDRLDALMLRAVVLGE